MSWQGITLIVSNKIQILENVSDFRGDFRTLSQETEGGKDMTVEESEYLMALFGTFPADSEI